MKLRTQILAFGLAGAGLAVLAGSIGLFASMRLGTAVEASIDASQALQASQEADMMHDAIRGDGQLALLGLLEQSPERVAEADQGLAEHAKTFNESLAKVSASALAPDSREALETVLPLVKAYAGVARKMIASAQQGERPPQGLVQAFQSAFVKLEKQMAALSESLEQHGSELNLQAQRSVTQAQWAIAIALVVATTAMLSLALALARHITVPMQAAVSAADRLAQGDLSQTIEPKGNDETRRLLEAMARMQQNFGGIVREVQANADRVASASSQIAHGNHDLSQRTEQQASSLQETAAAMGTLGTTVRDNADNASQANQLALGASQVAQQGGEMMTRVVQTMTDINASSRRIADIVGVIDSIAFQTNILALNAAVEAARAGEQGRGFAVVASEVRGLAQRSAGAAREIKGLIAASVERVEHGTTLVGQTGQTMEEIVGAIRRVNDIVAEISNASAQQRTGVEQVGQAVAQIDQSTQQTAAQVEQSAAAAESLSEQARALVQTVAAFRLDATPATEPSHAGLRSAATVPEASLA